MTHDIESLYNELGISRDVITSFQIDKLEDWIGKHISSDYMNFHDDLSLRFADDEKLLIEYFNKRNFSVVDCNLLQFAIAHGWDKFLDFINPSAEQINNTPNALRLAVVDGHFHTLKFLCSKGLKPPSLDRKILYAALILPFTHTKKLKQKKEIVFNFLVKNWPGLILVNNDEGSTIFHTMAENNFDGLISNYLPSYKKLAYVMNNQGLYPVTCAILNRGYESVEALLKMSEASKLEDYKKRLPIHYAARYSDNRMISLCLSADHSILDSKDKHGQTPLHLACIEGNADTANALIAARADINKVDNFKRSALHYVAINNNLELIKSLLNQPDIVINSKDEEGRTPLDYSTDDKVQQLLIAKGAIATGKERGDFSSRLNL